MFRPDQGRLAIRGEPKDRLETPFPIQQDNISLRSTPQASASRARAAGDIAKAQQRHQGYQSGHLLEVTRQQAPQLPDLVPVYAYLLEFELRPCIAVGHEGQGGIDHQQDQ